MAPLPAPTPSSPTAYTAPFAGAGGGNLFQSSGPCSGTTWTHTQDLTIFYEVVTYPRPTGGTWLPSTTDVSALKLTVMGNAGNSLDFFVTSSVSGASGCATAADARQAHVLALSSTTITTSNAMGGAGAIYTLSGGYERRWTQTGDVAQVDNRFYGEGLFEINGLPNNWIYDPTLSTQVARQIISRVCNGGIRYSNDGTAPPATAGNWELMKFSLMDV